MFVTAVIFTTYFAYIEIGLTISEKRGADEWDLLCMVWYHFSYSVPQSWTTDIWDVAQRRSDIRAEISRCIAGNNSLALRPGLLFSCFLNPVFFNRYFAWRTSNIEFVWEKHIFQYVWKRVRDQYVANVSKLTAKYHRKPQGIYMQWKSFASTSNLDGILLV